MAAIIRLAVVALAIAASAATSAADASTVCRGSYITGFEKQAQTAALVLGQPTSDPAAMRVYAETTPRAYYYEANYVRPGQHDFTKIVSEVPLTPRQIVQNMMFVSREEIAANPAVIETALRALDADPVMLASLD